MIESRRDWLLLGALLLAFSPVIHDLLGVLEFAPDQRYILLPLLLMGLLLHDRKDLRRQPRDPMSGIAVLLLGLGAQILGISSGTWLIARLGFPIALLGLSRIVGGPNASVLVLAFALVPIPDFVKHLTSPGLESLLTSGAANVLQLIGLPIEVGGPLAEHGDGRLELQPADSGIITLVLLAEFGWYRAVRDRRSVRTSLGCALGSSLLAWIVQPLLVLSSLLWLPLGHPEFGRFLLTHFVTIALAAIVVVLRPRGRSAERPTDHPLRSTS